MRNLKPGGIFKYAVPKNGVKFALREFEEGVKICESMYYQDKNNLVLQGYVYMDRNFNVKCEANNVGGVSLREAMQFPKYKWYFCDLQIQKS
jgi:hypothetical protein